MLVLLSAKRQIFQQFSSICLYFLLWLPFSGIPYTGDWKYQLEIYRFKEWGKSSNVWKRKELLWGSGVGGAQPTLAPRRFLPGQQAGLCAVLPVPASGHPHPHPAGELSSPSSPPLSSVQRLPESRLGECVSCRSHWTHFSTSLVSA